MEKCGKNVMVGTKIVGTVEGDVFIKRVKASIHFLQRPPSIAFDKASLKAAEKLGATTVKVIDTETGKVYRTFVRKIWDKGFTVNRGFGEQVALILSDWTMGNDVLGEQKSML